MIHAEHSRSLCGHATIYERYRVTELCVIIREIYCVFACQFSSRRCGRWIFDISHIMLPVISTRVFYLY